MLQFRGLCFGMSTAPQEIGWTHNNLVDLQWWMLQSNLPAGRDLQDVSLDFLLYMDASIHSWGCSLLHYTVGGLWSKEESALHIYLLELQSVWLALLHFQHLQGKIVGVFADNTTALAYLSYHGSTHSSALNDEAQWTLCWVESKSICLWPQFISGSYNVVADFISRRSQVLSTEWTLHLEFCRALWWLWGMPLMDLFASSLNCSSMPSPRFR